LLNIYDLGVCRTRFTATVEKVTG